MVAELLRRLRPFLADELEVPLCEWPREGKEEQEREIEAAILGRWPAPGVGEGFSRAAAKLLAYHATFRSAFDEPLPFMEEGRIAYALYADSLTLEIEMEGRDLSVGGRIPKATAILPLEGGEPSCSCAKWRNEGKCLHIGFVTVVSLDALSKKGDFSEEIGALLEGEPWLRTLEALDDVFDEEEAELLSERLAWRIARQASGAVTLKLYRQKVVPGGWSKGKLISWYDFHDEPKTTQDARCMQALFPGVDWYREPTRSVPFGLQALRGHPFVFLASEQDEPVRIEEGQLEIRMEENERGEVELVPTVSGHPVPAQQLVASLDAHEGSGRAVVIDEERLLCLLVPVDQRTEGLLRVLARSHPRFPKEAVPQLLERVDRIRKVVPLDLPESMLGVEVPLTNEVVFRLRRTGQMTYFLEALVEPIPGSLPVQPGEGDDLVVAVNDEGRCFAYRDIAAEIRRLDEVLASFPLPAPVSEDECFSFFLHEERALSLFTEFGEREAEPGWRVEWPKGHRFLRPAQGADLRLQVRAKADWFGLEGGLVVDGVQVDLALAFDAVHRGAPYVEAQPGVFVGLADELRKALAKARDHIHDGRSGLEVSFAAAPALDELLADGGELDAAQEFRELLERIQRAEALDAQVPEGLLAELRPYQVEGFRWLARLASWGAGGCLADDMGLGKTLQSLALILHRREEGPALVVAPTSVCGGWQREAERFAPSLEPIQYSALTFDEREELELGPGDLLLVSYGLLARDIEILERHRFGTLIIDEAQAIKNPQAQRTQAVRRIDAAVRVALSGTPMENHLGELWSLFRVVLPGYLGSVASFRKRFALPIERSGDPERREALATVLRPFLLRRTKGEVARDLPARTEVEVPIELSAGERRLYEEARLAAAARVQGLDPSLPPEQRRFEILAALTRLRLCACHPVLYDKRSRLPSSKLERLVETLGELRAGGHRALVFSQFTKHLDLAEAALRAQGLQLLRLDGSTPAAARQGLVDAWQAGEGDAFLISLKAGGTGLNLTGADTVIHLDPWWNPAAEDQATDRAHRIGQTRPVTVLRFIAQGTIEEQILALHAQKRELVASVLDGADGASRIDTDELIALLTGGEPADAAEEETYVPVEASVGASVEEDQGVADAGVGEVLDLLNRLEAHLEEQERMGRILPTTVRSYMRSADRFGAWLGARGWKHGSVPLEILIDRYLEDLTSGAWTAPKSEPLVARAAQGRLQGLAAGGG